MTVRISLIAPARWERAVTFSYGVCAIIPDYPKSKLDIKLVVEQRDPETLSRLVELELPARYEIVVAPPGAPQTKPRALNIALATARGELIVVYDAEDIPAPNQLRLAAARFAAEKDLDCLQGRLAIRNAEESWLARGIM